MKTFILILSLFFLISTGHSRLLTHRLRKNDPEPSSTGPSEIIQDLPLNSSTGSEIIQDLPLNSSTGSEIIQDLPLNSSTGSEIIQDLPVGSTGPQAPHCGNRWQVCCEKPVDYRRENPSTRVASRPALPKNNSDEKVAPPPNDQPIDVPKPPQGGPNNNFIQLSMNEKPPVAADENDEEEGPPSDLPTFYCASRCHAGSVIVAYGYPECNTEGNLHCCGPDTQNRDANNGKPAADTTAGTTGDQNRNDRNGDKPTAADAGPPPSTPPADKPAADATY